MVNNPQQMLLKLLQKKKKNKKKKKNQKVAEATGDCIGNKIADKITNVFRT